MKNFSLFSSSLLKTSALSFVASLVPLTAQAQTPVALELSLLNDVSGSISTAEFQLQVEGYAQAFENLATLNFVPFATNFIFWSSGNQQQEAISWRLIDNAAAAQSYADDIRVLSRPFSGNTAPGSAIFASRVGTSDVTSIFNNQFIGNRLVFDMSGDGVENSGVNTSTQRDLSAAAGITINGLAIGGSSAVESFYQNDVITNDGFFLAASTFADFQSAISQKIEREVINPRTPEPASILGLLTVSGLLVSLKKKATLGRL